jgi:hypothetical protein
MKEQFSPMGLDVSRPDAQLCGFLRSLYALQSLIYGACPLNSNKAVADGAISFRIDHLVREQVSESTPGTDTKTSSDLLIKKMVIVGLLLSISYLALARARSWARAR